MSVTLPGTGNVVATETIGGEQFQLVKPVIGAPGVNDGPVSSDNPMPVADPQSRTLLRRMADRLEAPPGFNKSTQRQSVSAALEAGQTLATVTTVTTVTTITNAVPLGNLATLGGADPRGVPQNNNYSAWAACVRARIT